MTNLNNASKSIHKTAIASAVVLALGGAAAPGPADAAELVFSWEGYFTMLDPGGGALGNTSITGKNVNTFQTPVTGTMTFDTIANTGTATLVPFDFFKGSLPAEAVGINMVAIGDGMGGGGTLIMGNMLFNWNGNYGIPVSIVLDGAGLFSALGSGVAVGDTIGQQGAGTTLECVTDINCAEPASDGTFVGATVPGTDSGYLSLGPVPVATTEWNLTNTPDCIVDDPGTPEDETDCMNVSPSGMLPLVTDTATNVAEYDRGDGVGIGGVPMWDGPFSGNNANFDITKLTLISDGSGSITAPPDVSDDTVPDTPPLPATWPIALGAATNVSPAGTAEYCTDGSVAACDAGAIDGWIADDGSTNTIQVPITQTVNTVQVDWRAGGGAAFDTQIATVTVDDQTPPTITSTPGPVTVEWPNTAIPLEVCFGAATATDAVEPNVVVEYSINSESNWQLADPADNCSTDFLLNDNTVNWRARDAAVPDPNISAVTTQTVTLNLPDGITGTECTVDLLTEGFRDVAGRFIMRDSSGGLVGSVDNTVTGDIDTTLLCEDASCSNLPDLDSAATLVTTQPFFQLLWAATPIMLYGEGSYQFETCPFPRTLVSGDWVAADGSTKCGSQFDPNPVNMDVGPGQLGAHMLFEWGTSVAIDVVVVWDVDCNQFQLTATDPDGDGVLATPMVDGPFKGFNAAFDVSTVEGFPPIADGGFSTIVDVAQNPVAGESPLPLTLDALPVMNDDPDAIRSCVGGCKSFTTTELVDGNDGGGDYQYAQVVLPLTEATPFWSLYRKYDTEAGAWKGFIIDGRNNVKTSPLNEVNGCPEPGDGSYDRPSSGSLAGKLRGGDRCVQLTIEDGGPNDADAAVDGSVTDPGGVAEVPSSGIPDPSTSGGGCSLAGNATAPRQAGAWALLALMLGWLGWKRRRS